MFSRIQSRLAWLRASVRQALGYPFVRNVNRAAEGSGCRRCLLVYLSPPFTRPPGHPSFLLHQNLGQAKIMASVLDEAGYSIDVADVRSRRLPASAGVYDLIVTHHPSFKFISGHLSEQTVVAYLAAGMHHAVHNRLVTARLDALESRRHCRIPPFALHDEAMTVLTRADAVTGFGNRVTMGTWENAFQGTLYPFNNSGFGWIRPAAAPACDFARHFLFFGSTDQVRKGLDLLLEVFPRHPGLHLHVAGYYGREPEFCACYRRELYHVPTIHLHGEVVIGSPVWESLIRQCAFVILPSCSEGQAGSVVQAMLAGLIPVVTPAVGLDVEPFGVLLPDDPLPVLDATVERLAMIPAGDLSRLRDETLKAARARYSESAFFSRWREIVRDLSCLGRSRRGAMSGECGEGTCL